MAAVTVTVTVTINVTVAITVTITVTVTVFTVTIFFYKERSSKMEKRWWGGGHCGWINKFLIVNIIKFNKKVDKPRGLDQVYMVFSY